MRPFRHPWATHFAATTEACWTIRSRASKLELREAIKKNNPYQIDGMAEQWGDAVYAARRRGDDTTREAMFTYTNSNNTKGKSYTI